MSLSKAQVFRDSMSVALPVGSYGIAFGAAAVANGFSVIQASLFHYYFSPVHHSLRLSVS